MVTSAFQICVLAQQRFGASALNQLDGLFEAVVVSFLGTDKVKLSRTPMMSLDTKRVEAFYGGARPTVHDLIWMTLGQEIYCMT